MPLVSSPFWSFPFVLNESEGFLDQSPILRSFVNKACGRSLSAAINSVCLDCSCSCPLPPSHYIFILYVLRTKMKRLVGCDCNYSSYLRCFKSSINKYLISCLIKCSVFSHCVSLLASSATGKQEVYQTALNHNAGD